MKGASAKVRATRVIKIGGRAQADARLAALLADAWAQAPGTLVVVHGGGDEVSELQRLYGVEPKFIGGRRVTAPDDVERLRMALSGSANKRLVAALVGAGAPAVGLSGEDASLLGAHVEDPSMGRVGVPVAINGGLLELLLGAQYLPVISPVSRDVDGMSATTAALNVNGDDAAAAIAVALQASELLLVSDVEGVLVDGGVASSITQDEVQRLIDDGTAAGGMAAKLGAAVAALEGGVPRVRIGGIAAIEHSDRGTVVTRANSPAWSN